MQLPVYCETCGSIVLLDAPPGEEASCDGCAAPLRVPIKEDVFVSFSFKDMSPAQEVARTLLSAGIRAWLATDRTGTGDNFLVAVSEALEAARVYLVLLSRHSASSLWVREELTYARSRGLPMIALKLEPFEMPAWMRLALGGSIWEDAFHRPFEQRLNLLVSDVRRLLLAAAVEPVPPIKESDAPILEPGPAAPHRGVAHAECPYVGPLPFNPHESGLFFGRDDDVRRILARLRESRAILLYAPSGAGKSSLLNTVVRRQLEESGADVLPGTRVGISVPEAVRARSAEIVNIFSYSAVSGLRGESLPDPRCTLAGYLAMLPRRPRAWARVLVIDQFEELFTQHAERHEDRAGFVADLCEALHTQPDLKVILSMRQEYLANLDEHSEAMPPDLRPARIWLRRLEGRSALEAVTCPAEPYAEFDDGVAQEIVRQLGMMTVVGPDGGVVKKRSEFIELVHLQIVCRRLWSRLPEGLTRIEMKHLRLAAGEGGRFDELVDNALVEFYDEVVRETARCATDPAAPLSGRSGFPEELIRLGCMKFVNAAGTRITIQQDRRAGRTGRLPNWVVDDLERRHLLRAEQRGGERWYELSHDLLAETVSRGRGQAVSALLVATDLLETMLGRARESGDQRLRGYFRAHDELLSECRPFRSQPGLFEDEAAFIFRASLASGQDAAAWSARLAEDYPDVRFAVLTDALAAAVPEVRANAAGLLGVQPVEALLAPLAELAVSDPDESVRRAAARSIARLDAPTLYSALIGRLNDPAQGPVASRALSLILNERDQRGMALGFEQCWATLPAGQRAGIRREARLIRLREGWVVIPYVVLPAALLSATAAALFKFVPGIFGWALCQATPSPIGGLFHGATAGLIWGSTIPLSITLYREVFGTRAQTGSMLRPIGALLFAGVAGLLTGLAVVMSVVGVFEVANLVEIGWLNELGPPEGPMRSPLVADFWLDLFFRTRFGWAYPITGIGLGIAMAMVANALRAAGALNDLKADEGVTDVRQIGSLIRTIAPRVLRRAWPILLLQVVAAAIALALMQPGANALQPRGSVLAQRVQEGRPLDAPWLASKATLPGRLVGLAVDCGSEAIGGLAAIIGMGVGIVIMSRGVHVHPRRDLS